MPNQEKEVLVLVRDGKPESLHSEIRTVSHRVRLNGTRVKPKSRQMRCFGRPVFDIPRECLKEYNAILTCAFTLSVWPPQIAEPCVSEVRESN